MNGHPTYDELLAANQQLQLKVEWLEGAFNANRDEGIRIKSRFLSNVSHEIRTPMNAILGFSNLLQVEGITEKEKNEYLFYISHNSHTLLKVMDNIIDLTLLETDNLKMNQELVSVRDLVKHVYEFHQDEIERTTNQDIKLLLDMPDDNQRVLVKADPYRLRRIIDNLVTSAVLYQKRGVVKMSVETPDNLRTLFTVRFDGNRQLSERAKMIFENNGNDEEWYHQLDNTGVAYKLVRDLTRAMGGTIGLRSREDDRIAIEVSLPVNTIVKEETKGTGMDQYTIVK